MSIEKFEIFFKKFGKGTKHDHININSLKKYKEDLPIDIYSLLEEEGVSSFMGDFLWTLNPDDYVTWLNDWIQFNVKCIPFARTALGDIIFIKDNIISILYSNKGIVKFLIHRPDWLFDKYLSNDNYVDENLSRYLYNEKKEKNEKLNDQECFGFVPLLSLGGSEKSENLKKVRLREYLYLLSQADGNITIEY